MSVILITGKKSGGQKKYVIRFQLLYANIIVSDFKQICIAYVPKYNKKLFEFHRYEFVLPIDDKFNMVGFD